MRSLSFALGQLGAVIAGIVLICSPVANAQDPAPKSSSDKTVAAPQAMGQTKKPAKKVALSDVAPLSTEEAARSAAKEAAQSPAKKKGDKSTDTGIDSVLEFHPASNTEPAAARSDARSRVKHAGKNIHGEAYGTVDATNPGTHQGGGALGATSKSGKTSVYVQGDQTRATQTPH
ncbi:MAG TPA: hypothetical protein VG028_00760 [Terriglobia bacterium]|nr:hypothetical protein [Terriglobia bacterium]